jgi:glycerophosphoryl diester phosphodiesterase
VPIGEEHSVVEELGRLPMDTHQHQRSQRPWILAHRGASQAAPENTLAAFRLAAEMGADGVELDVQLSKDGEAVVIHDVTVDKTTNGSGRVKDLTLAELQDLDAGSWYDSHYAGEPIPTLAQVLHELGPRLILNIELKQETFLSKGLEAEVIRLIEDTHMAHRVILSSFNPLALWRVGRLNPNVSTGLLYAPDQPIYLRQRWFQPAIRPSALHPRWDTIDHQFVMTAHRQGLAVHPWTCNEPEAMHRLIGWNVDAIITDHPDLLYDLLSDGSTGGQRERR